MPRNSAEILKKLQQLVPPATALLDSESIPITGYKDSAELVSTDRGRYLSSPVDGWVLHPFDGGA